MPALGGGSISGGTALSGGLALGFAAWASTWNDPMESRANQDPVQAKPFNPGRDCEGKCLPCPPNQMWPINEPGHGHSNGYWHSIAWNQNPQTCMCYPDRPSQNLPGW